MDARTRSLRERDESEREAGEVKRQLEEDADREIEELQDKCARAGAPAACRLLCRPACGARCCVCSMFCLALGHRLIQYNTCDPVLSVCLAGWSMHWAGSLDKQGSRSRPA